MKFITILIFVVVGIPVLKAFFEAVGKTKQEATLEKIVLTGFIKSVYDNNDEMTIEFNGEVAKILELNESKTFKLIGKVIRPDDYTGWYKKSYEKYAVKQYISDIIKILEQCGNFKNIKKDEKLDLMTAAKNGEIENYKYKYSIEKWTIETNSSFYITLATFKKGDSSAFAFEMTEY